MSDHNVPRRAFLKLAGLGAAGAALNQTMPSSNGHGHVDDLPDYAPVPKSALGPALNAKGYYVGRVEKNLYWVTDATYQCAFLTTKDGVVLLDAPPTIGHNIQRAIDEIAKANGVSSTRTTTPITGARRRCSARTSFASGTKKRESS